MIGKFQERIVNEITRGGLERRVVSHESRSPGIPHDQKNAGLKAVTLIATLNPVSQVLW
jgi:hypothetical protein